MSKFSDYIGRQFANPHGFVGKICCLIMNTINKKMYKKTVALLDLSEEDSLLDIGYGNGYLLKKIYKKNRCNLYGIDISDDMKSLATKKNKKAKRNGKLNLSVGDCCNLDYNDMFDAITSINTIYFWSDVEKGLLSIKSALKPNRSFYNVVYTKEWLDKLSYTNKGFKKFNPDELIALGNTCGFTRVEIKEIVKNKSFMVIYTK